MSVVEEARYSKDYLDPDKRSIANAVQVFFNDGTATDRIEVEYPLGHRRRREEGIPLLIEKARRNLATHYKDARTEQIIAACQDIETLKSMPVTSFMESLV